MSGRLGVRTVVGLALAALGWAAACGDDTEALPEEGAPSAEILQSMVEGRRDCPGHSGVKVFSGNGDSTMFSVLSVPKEITLVPEFHDCQRLLIGTKTSYGPTVGVFASNDLAMPSGPRFPVAEIVNFDAVPYSSLGIEKNFNCLYMFRDDTATNGIAARMVPVGDDETKCLLEYDVTMGGTPLLVVPYTPEEPLNWEDIPRVARWEWNPGTQTQYIGIRCDLQWCEVGPNGFSSSGDHKPDFNDKKEKRTFWIKGWYDEQNLAVRQGNYLKPDKAVGTIVPDKSLGDYSDATFPKETWVPAARVAINPHAAQYKKKLGLDHVKPEDIPGKMNQLELCKASWTVCAAASGESTIPTQPTVNCTGTASDWWARMVGAKGEIKYFCVTRTPHTHAIEGTARWRWHLKDETIWVRCAEGCCQVNSEEM